MVIEMDISGPSDRVERLFGSLKLRLDEQGAAAESDRARLRELGEMVIGLLAVCETHQLDLVHLSDEVQELKDRVLALEGQ